MPVAAMTMMTNSNASMWPIRAKRRDRDVSTGWFFFNGMHHLIGANIGTPSSAGMATSGAVFR